MIETEPNKNKWQFNDCAVIVAHPDDETLWAGGLILMHPQTKWTILSLCRKSDPDRSPKFSKVTKILNATGFIADIDDGPDQAPLKIDFIEEEILADLPQNQFDLILTHNTKGEYTRHLRHEEVAQAVINLVETGKLKTKALWIFAYEDSNRSILPKPLDYADKIITLPIDIWQKKYQIITKTYGFCEDSWEARTTPRKEAFLIFNSLRDINKSLQERGIAK